MVFGSYIREAREKLRDEDRRFSVRQVAQRIGVEPAYLSKVEREQVAPPSEGKIRRLAEELGEDPDLRKRSANPIFSFGVNPASFFLIIERRSSHGHRNAATHRRI